MNERRSVGFPSVLSTSNEETDDGKPPSDVKHSAGSTRGAGEGGSDMQREERNLARAGTCKTEMGQHGSRRAGVAQRGQAPKIRASRTWGFVKLCHGTNNSS